MKLVAGVDCHRDSHTIVFLDSVGVVAQELTIGAGPDGYARALQVAGSLSTDVTWGLEGTGSYGRSFAVALTNTGAVVYEVPGAFTKRHRKHASQRGKSDANDARAIAETVLREADRLSRFNEPDEQRALRLRYDQRDRLIRERTEEVNRLRAAALLLGRPIVQGDLTKPAALRKLQADIEPLSGQCYTTDAYVDEILFSIETIERLNRRVARIEAIIGPFVKALAPELLAIRGIATVAAAGLIGHGGNVGNYRDSAAFAMRCGTAPVSCSSGRSQTVRVNRGGNRQLNRVLHTAALAQIRHEGHPGRTYYQRKRAEGQTHAQAMRSLKRQITKVVFAPLRAAMTRADRKTYAAAA